MEKKKVTIYDIAKAAGVAPGTVSRALSNIGYMKPETKERIERIAREYKFLPNRAAQTLKTRRTGLIMLAMPDVDNPFYTELLQAAQEVLKHRHYALVLAFTEGKRVEEQRVLRMLREHYVDGLFLISMHLSPELLEDLVHVDKPVTVSCISRSGHVEAHEGVFDYVGVDTEKGMYLATLHLIQQGHEKIGYIGGIQGSEPFEERYRGFCRACQERRIPIQPEWVFWGTNMEHSGMDAASGLLKQAVRPTAICAANDMLAIGAMRGFEEAGLRVPEDVALAGMGNIGLGTRIRPMLTTVAIAPAEIGRMAAEFILGRLVDGHEDAPRRVIFEPRLIVRQSSSNAQYASI